MPRPSLVTSSGGPADLAEAARLAEEAGFESVWATEFYDRSATVALAAMAQATETIELGSAIAYAFGRTPVVLAAEARSRRAQRRATHARPGDGDQAHAARLAWARR